MNWISVEDQMPKEHETVLILLRSGCISQANLYEDGDYSEFDDTNYVGWFWEDHNRDWTVELADVTHWLPLSSLPKIPSKYDWSNVPNWVKWIATDADGNAWMYTKKPGIGGEDSDQWVGEEEVVHHHGFRKFLGNWEDSLEQRPGEPQ